MTRAPSATRGLAVEPGADTASWASLYDVVGERLEALISLLALRHQAATIGRTYRRLCSESLAVPVGDRPLRRSRLNADGTPFQLALALGAGTPPLQFLADTGPPLADNDVRLAAARDGVEELAHLLGAADSLPHARALLDELAPPDALDLLADEAGAIWLGASFASGRNPQLKVYVNLKWGTEASRRARLQSFAASSGLAAPWERIRPHVEGLLGPLGVSLDLAAGRAIAGRIYLSGYGRSVREYEALAGACDSALEDCVRRYCTILLGDDRHQPTRSAVFSLGGQPGSPPEYKLELCAHCALASDVEARERSLEWLDEIGISPRPYLRVLDILSPGPLGHSATELHVYLGVGTRQGAAYSTFYLNPAVGIR